jgi:succinyl-CoA synthetase beta subunit
MNIHEYQAKSLLRSYGVPIPPGGVAFSPQEAQEIAQTLKAPWIIKAQIHAGGRGKGGGVKLQNPLRRSILSLPKYSG